MEAANNNLYISLLKKGNIKAVKPVISALLLLILLFFSTGSVAQDLQKKITLKLVDEPLEIVLKEIGKKGDILFSYNPLQIPVNKKITIIATGKPVKEVLDEVLGPLNITYFISGKQVILKTKTGTDGEKQLHEKKSSFTISGYLRDSLSGEVLIGAAIYDKSTGKGTLSNAYGFYSLTLLEGLYEIHISILGYRQKAVSVKLDRDVRLDYSLTEAVIEMTQVNIIAENEAPVIDAGTGGQVRLSSVTLKRMSGFAGNVDVIKSLQSIPGINAFGDGSAFYFVRGGDKDQNLMLIDEAPIFNPAHLFGFFSALAPDAIKDVKAYKGDLPASYGGRLSSVIDIHARDGNMNRLGFSGNIGIFTSDYTFEGPIVREKSSFILSARLSNLKWLTRTITEQGRSLSIKFHDLNLKMNLKINDKNRLFITGFSGRDDFSRVTDASINTYGLSWTNVTGTMRWNHLFSNKLFLNTTALFGEYNYFLYISREQGNYWASSIRTGTLKSDLTWYVNPDNTYKAGVEFSRHKSNPGNIHFADESLQAGSPQVSPYHSIGACYYISNERLFFKKLTIKPGLRLSNWRNLGPGTVYFFDVNYKVSDTVTVDEGSYYSPYTNLEPRFSISYKLSSNASVTGGYTRTVQYLQLLSNSTSPFTTLDVWAPAGPVIKPQKADQYTFGYHNSRQKINYSAEVFYKKLYNQIDYEEHANMLYNPLIEGELRFGETTAYGIELLARKSEGRISGWVGYSWSRALRTVADLNGGKEYPASFDHPNTVCINLLWKLSQRFDLSANWIYMTGAPFTSATGFFEYNGYVVPVYGEKNNDRFPDYHRLDLSMTFRLNKPDKKFRHNLVLSLYNAYGRSNPFSVSFNKIMDDKGNFVVPSDLGGELEIIPTRISVAGIIPSLNYTFKL